MEMEDNQRRYNLREKFNLYATPLVGAVAPIMGLKWIFDHNLDYSSVPNMMSWGIATVVSGASGLSLGGLAAGMVLGKLNANQLARKRFERESALEVQ